MPKAEPHVALAERHCLAEGPLWDDIREQLLWVDIHRGVIFQGKLRSDRSIEVVARVELDAPVGAVAVADDGSWIIAARDRLIYRSHDGTLTNGPIVFSGHPSRRLNDGKPDPAGRFVVGTLDEAGPSEDEVLAIVGHDGSITPIDTDLTLSNGLAWTANGRILYNVDTLSRRIFQRDYDPRTGASGERTVFAELAAGYPDGMTVDSEDHLWVAVWGLGEVHRYSPDGELVDVVQVPAPHTSSVTFAGPDLDTLVITTATADLSDELLEEFPQSGQIFACVPGVSGRLQPRWAGHHPASSTHTNESARKR